MFEEDGFSCLNPNNNKPEIYYNDRISPSGRIKFTIPHELGHISLGHKYYLHKETATKKEKLTDTIHLARCVVNAKQSKTNYC